MKTKMRSKMRALLKWLVKKLGLEEGVVSPSLVQKKMSHPDHLNLAMSQVGVKEIKGPRHHSQIIKYLESVDLAPQFKRDETPWCSAFVNWCMPRGFRTDSALARSWMVVGEEINMHNPSFPPKEGDICVFYRRDSEYQGHVGFFIAFNDKRNKVLVLGGNQDDGVCYKWYPVNGKNMFLRSIRRI